MCHFAAEPPGFQASVSTNFRGLGSAQITKDVGRRSSLFGVPLQVLSSLDLDGVARYVQEAKVRNVVVLCGAGVSTAAGIPDFRSPGTGLYDNLQQCALGRSRGGARGMSAGPVPCMLGEALLGSEENEEQHTGMWNRMSRNAQIL